MKHNGYFTFQMITDIIGGTAPFLSFDVVGMGSPYIAKKKQNKSCHSIDSEGVSVAHKIIHLKASLNFSRRRWAVPNKLSVCSKMLSKVATELLKIYIKLNFLLTD